MMNKNFSIILEMVFLSETDLIMRQVQRQII